MNPFTFTSFFGFSIARLRPLALAVRMENRQASGALSDSRPVFLTRINPSTPPPPLHPPAFSLNSFSFSSTSEKRDFLFHSVHYSAHQQQTCIFLPVLFLVIKPGKLPGTSFFLVAVMPHDAKNCHEGNDRCPYFKDSFQGWICCRQKAFQRRSVKREQPKSRESFSQC